MMNDYVKFNHNGLIVEVNWNENVKPCRKIRFIIDGKEVLVDREDFYSMMMLFGDEDQQTNLIPTKVSKVIMVRKMLKLRARKDIKKGGLIQTMYEYPVAEDVYYKMKLSDHTLSKSDKYTNS